MHQSANTAADPNAGRRASRAASALLLRRLDATRWRLARRERDRIIQHQRARGAVLVGQIVLPSFGAKESALLLDGDVFGDGTAGLRDRLPLILAFGYEIGLALCHVAAVARRDVPTAAATCGLINLGVTLFDLQCDRARDGAARLGQVFDGQALEHLLDHGLGARREADRAAAEAGPRLVLTAIDAVFAHLAAWQDRAGWPALAEAMRRSYRAQLACTDRSGLGAQALAAAASAKSRGPFLLMMETVALAAVRPDAIGSARRLADRIATIFWLIDDLADLGRDARTGDVNALWLTASATGRPIEAVALDAAGRTAALLAELASALSRCGSREALGLQRLLLAHALAWLPLP